MYASLQIDKDMMGSALAMSLAMFSQPMTLAQTWQ